MIFFPNRSHFVSSVLSEIPHIAHGYSVKLQGDMREQSAVLHFSDTLGTSSPVYFPSQVHGDHIVINPTEAIPQKADGVLLFRDQSTIQSLGVLAGDCIPILFSDSSGSCIGAVHSGWKGTYSNIAEIMIKTMCSLGVSLERIRVGVGPHIGACCYVVSEERIQLFGKKYTNVSEYAYCHNGNWSMDIGRILLQQLMHVGIAQQHIDTGIFCTSCQKDLFFSYRRDSKKEFGEMAAVIGFV